MALKKNFTQEESMGLTQEEIKIGIKYLRKHKTAGILGQVEALKVYEMYMIGCSFAEIQKQFPQYELGKLILTSAIKRWGIDRDKMQQTLRDRVKAKVVKSVIDQVDFLTTMLSANNAKHLKKMQDYISDPEHNKEPDISIKSIKDYKDITETLYKIVQGATPNSNTKTSPMFDALASTNNETKRISNDSEDEDDDLTLDGVITNE